MSRKDYYGAFLWGLAEAALFFIVPDVLLSWIALGDVRRALRASLWALGGALVGGGIMYAWGVTDLATARVVLDALPAINEALLDGVAASMQSHGAWAITIAPLQGVPYKIYAVHAAGNGIGPFAFFAVSVLARLMRFILVILLAALLARWAAALARLIALRWPNSTHIRTAHPRIRVLHLLAWGVFYTGYFAIMAS